MITHVTIHAIDNRCLNGGSIRNPTREIAPHTQDKLAVPAGLEAWSTVSAATVGNKLGDGENCPRIKIRGPAQHYPMVVHDELAMRLAATTVGDDAIIRKPRLPADASVAFGRPAVLREVARSIVSIAERDARDNERLHAAVLGILRRLA